MGKKYISPITAKINPDNWEEKINLAAMSLDDVIDLLGDFKKMEAFSKKLTGFLKEAVKAKLPDGETEYKSRNFFLALNARVREGGLDKERILEEYGEGWVASHSKPPTEYVELRLKPLSGEEEES